MADSSASYLSNDQYKCDFVIATTQASINSDLLKYFHEVTQPVEYLCFLADKDGNPNDQISLDELLQRTGGINPFYIPDGTDCADPRIQKLTNARFAVGIKIQMGLPPGIMPQDMPAIISLGNSADNVTFNMLCSQVSVIQNSPSYAWVKGSWNVWSQNTPTGKPWTVRTRVDLVVKDLDKELDTPYFKGHPKIRDKLLKALENLSGTAFSLQQLVFDLENAEPETVPSFEGVSNSKAAQVLQDAILSLYKKSDKSRSWPLVSVTAVPQDPDPSTLQITAFERIVCPLVDEHGVQIADPSPTQQSATTLNYLCAVKNDTVSSASKFNWNWVRPEDVDERSGMIAINRDILAQYMLEQLKPAATAYCYVPFIDGPYNYGLKPGGCPQTAEVTSDNSNIIHIEYRNSAKGTISISNSSVSATGDLTIQPVYSCDVFVEGQTVRVEQHLWVALYGDIIISFAFGPFDKFLTTTYTISVTQDGVLQLGSPKEDLIDSPDPLPFSPDLMDPGLVDVMDSIVNSIDDTLSYFVPSKLDDLQISQLHNFVFPGGKVFTYKNPCFSEHQDLLCELTYLDPEEVSSTNQSLSEAVIQTAAAADSTAFQKGSGRELAASVDLLQNYIQGEIVSPAGKFEALQSSDGHALLFAIDSSGIFHVVAEGSGTSSTGWKVYDLSTKAIQIQFPGQDPFPVVRTFDVGQSAADGSIGLMMTVSLDGNDHLFISLGNSSSEISWVKDPVWTMLPFDPVNEEPQKIVTAGALFGEAADKKEYLIVDIRRSSGSTADSPIVRYHIDPTREGGHYWVKHDVSVDISSGNYQSCVGRVKDDLVDGVYTVGTTDGESQFIYEPIINVWGRGPPAPRRLCLPGGAVPSAIGTVRNTDGSTDLYAVGGCTLYWFPSDEQTEDYEPTSLLENDIFSGTDILRAMTHSGVTTLWGRNASNQVYYLACPTDQLGQPDAWSTPVPILAGAERISPFVNRADGGNTIFAASNGRFQKLMQGTVEAGRLWTAQDIIIAPSPEQRQRPLNFMSYTTIIHVTDKDLPVPNAVVHISANSRKPVFINGLYYVVSSTSIRVATDAMGSVTVVEPTDGINGTVLTISLSDDTAITVNPMDHTFCKLTELDTQAKLRNARFSNQTIAGGIMGSPGSTPLVPPAASDDDLNAVAESLGLLKNNYPNTKGPKEASASQTFVRDNRGVVPSRMFRSGTTRVSNLNFLGDLWDHITVAFGDLSQWLKHTWDDVVDTVKHVVQIVHDAASNTLHFLVTIGGQIYHAVLDTVDAVVGAAEWVFKAVKTAIQDIVHFVQFLFEWDDIRCTKDVLHNLVRLWMQHQVDNLPQIRVNFDNVIAGVEGTVCKWAGITDWSPLGEIIHKPAAASASNPAKGQTSSSQLLVNHYRDHAHELQFPGLNPTTDGVDGIENLIDDLLGAISQEGAVLGEVFDQLKELSSQFTTLSVVDILKRLLAILADGLLSSVQVVVDALLNVLCQLSQSVVTLLDTKIYIPIISDILNAIGVPDISFLDLFSWIIAVAYTVTYKIANANPPFSPDDPSVAAMTSAQTWDEIAKLVTVSEGMLNSVFVGTHSMAGLGGIVGSIIVGPEADFPTGDNPLATSSGVLALVVGAIKGVGEFLVPKDPIDNKTVSVASDVVLGLFLINKGIFSSIGQGILKNKSINKKVKLGGMTVQDPRGVGALCDCILVIPSLIITEWHLYELCSKPAGKTRSAAIVGEVSSLAASVARVSYGFAVNDEEEVSRQIAIGTLIVSSLACAGLQIAEGCLGAP